MMIADTIGGVDAVAGNSAAAWAALAALTSAVSAGFMAATFWNQRRHNRLSVQPRLQFCWQAGHADPLGSGLIIEDNGLSTAIITRFEVHVGGQILTGQPRSIWAAAAAHVEALAHARGIFIPPFRAEQLAFDAESSIAAGQRRLVWGMLPDMRPNLPATDWRTLFEFFSEAIVVHIDYQSIYGDKAWRLDSTNNTPRVL